MCVCVCVHVHVQNTVTINPYTLYTHTSETAGSHNKITTVHQDARARPPHDSDGTANADGKRTGTEYKCVFIIMCVCVRLCQWGGWAAAAWAAVITMCTAQWQVSN